VELRTRLEKERRTSKFPIPKGIVVGWNTFSARYGIVRIVSIPKGICGSGTKPVSLDVIGYQFQSKGLW